MWPISWIQACSPTQQIILLLLAIGGAAYGFKRWRLVPYLIAFLGIRLELFRFQKRRRTVVDMFEVRPAVLSRIPICVSLSGPAGQDARSTGDCVREDGADLRGARRSLQSVRLCVTW